MLESLEFSGLNDDEIKRIMSVVERDFKLRQQESKRLEELKQFIRQEHERVEYLAGSQEFNHSRCIRCFKPFKMIFHPKEICSLCKLYVCHDCATYNKQIKAWTCKLCFSLQELEYLTADWFYTESGKKYKRCGSAKVVRELYKREKQLAEVDEDVGYGTLQKRGSTDSKDSSSVASYVVHDRSLRSELNQYSKRMNILLENLHSDVSTHKVNLKDHLQQLTAEITRARMALSGPLRKTTPLDSNTKFGVYEFDLQNLLIQKTEEILQTSFREFKRKPITSNFDQKLAQLILKRFTKQEIPSKLEPFIREGSSSLTAPPPAVDEEDTENEDEQRTPTELDPSSSLIPKSTERVADWKLNCTLVESRIVPPDTDEQEAYRTWF